MEVLKMVSCFTDAEAPSTRMSYFFSLTKRVSVNMGGDLLPLSRRDFLLALPNPPYPTFNICRSGLSLRLQKWQLLLFYFSLLLCGRYFLA